jgi:ribosomal protein S18 acetylase RimI-like enzyme
MEQSPRRGAHVARCDRVAITAMQTFEIDGACARAQLRDDGIGLVGFFSATSPEESDAAKRVLQACAAWLRERGATAVRGPVDGSTWGNYRFIVDGSEAGTFRGEPSHPAYYVDLWRDAGARECAHYGSYWMKDPAAIVEKMAARAAELRGVRLRAANLADLPIIHALAMRGFSDAFMFSPISMGELAQLYAGGRTDGAIAYLAYLDGTPVGFVYCFEAELPRGRIGIAKTIAVVPEARDRGIYHALCARAFGDLLARGVDDILVALIHDDGAPATMGWSQPEQRFRSYALFDL